jgi:hypothetical protein
MPGRRGVRWRRLRPQTKGCLWACQEAVDASTAATTSGQVSKRRPFKAQEPSTFHQGSIRFKYAAYLGWETRLPAWMGQHEEQESVAVVHVQIVQDGVDPLHVG